MAGRCFAAIVIKTVGMFTKNQQTELCQIRHHLILNSNMSKEEQSPMPLFKKIEIKINTQRFRLSFLFLLYCEVQQCRPRLLFYRNKTLKIQPLRTHVHVITRSSFCDLCLLYVHWKPQGPMWNVHLPPRPSGTSSLFSLLFLRVPTLILGPHYQDS